MREWQLIQMRSRLVALYETLVLGHPMLVLLGVAILTAALAMRAPDFRLDASGDSLLLQDDADLRYYRSLRARYGSDDYVVITYRAEQLFSEPVLADLRRLRDELQALPGIESIISILDVPIIESPPISLDELQAEVPTLLSPRTDREAARRELIESPIYRQLLMSPDGKTTAILATFVVDPVLDGLLRERDALLERALRVPLERPEERAVEALDARIFSQRAIANRFQDQNIAAIREILDRHRAAAVIHLGGVPMIVTDMLDYIVRDVVVFGAGILLFIVLLLALIFRRPRWVALPLLCCAVGTTMMFGYLGWVRWPVTVVSANFVALMLIFGLSLAVHLIVRYRELHVKNPAADQHWLVRRTLRDKFEPSLYTTTTTMVAFASLVVSRIQPVIDFGWMMLIAMVLLFGLTFTLFPAVLVKLSLTEPKGLRDFTGRLTRSLASLVERRPGPVGLAYLAVAVLALVGIRSLTVENRFIDYFDESTEIYQGMVEIDTQLGGTTPLDVILDAEAGFDGRTSDAGTEAAGPSADEEFGDAFEDEFADDFAAEQSDLGATSYWYNTFRLETVRRVHEYLESLPETGKVLSMATTLETLKTLNAGEDPDTFFLSLLYKKLPQDVKSALFDPYMSVDGNQVRFSVRVYESNPELRRGELLERIRLHLVETLDLTPEQVHLSGMLVLYNNVLQSLFRSQILTIGFVFLAILAMFGLLFRSAPVALIALTPNVLAAGAVLGMIGWLNIPLDVMTITIAAITIGIGVDDSIHYVHRFREEFLVDGDYLQAMRRSHATIGLAMFYTSVIITAGFAILALSNFIPTIYFGVFTGFAMIFAMVANLTLLPLLLLRLKPFGAPASAA